MGLSDRYDCTLSGRGYMIDWKSGAYRHQSTPMVRAQADTGDRPGEQSLNPDGLWPRSVGSWHHGAGQSWLDRDGSDKYRYNTSKGVDPWTRWQLGLLNDTDDMVTGLTGTTFGATGKYGPNEVGGIYLAVGSRRLYVVSGNTINLSGDGTTSFTTATGVPTATGINPCMSMTSDGSYIYATFGTDGIYSTVGGDGTVFSSFAATGGVDNLVAFVNGNLWLGAHNMLYHITGAGAYGGSEFYEHPNPNWIWTAFGEGQSHTYFAGHDGYAGKAGIYRTSLQDDGVTFNVPVVAAPLPDGEIAWSLTGYLGYMVIGTSLGIRFAVANDDGSLTLGALIETDNPVFCGEGQGRFVWYGLTNLDGTSSGLGRMDLSTFIADLTPAYAPDLMATTQGDVTGVCTYLGYRWFAVADDGVYAEALNTPVTSGSITLGKLDYGLPYPKTPIKVRVHHEPLPASASVAVSLASDDAAPVAVGTSSTDSATVADLPTTATPAEVMELSATITGAVVRRITLLADPSSDRTIRLQVPLLLADRIDDTSGQAEVDVDVQAEIAALEALLSARTVVDYVRRGRTRQVVVDDIAFLPSDRSVRPDGEQGTYVVTLKVVGEAA